MWVTPSKIFKSKTEHNILMHSKENSSCTVGLLNNLFIINDRKTYEQLHGSSLLLQSNRAQKFKFYIIDFFSKCDQIRSFLRIWSHLLRKSSMKKFIFCAVKSAKRFFKKINCYTQLEVSFWTNLVLLQNLNPF